MDSQTSYRLSLELKDSIDLNSRQLFEHKNEVFKIQQVS